MAVDEKPEAPEDEAAEAANEAADQPETAAEGGETAGDDASEAASSEDEGEPEASVPAAAAPSLGGGSPSWILPTYLAGLVLLFLGQRVLVALEGAATICSVAGVTGVVIATLMRFAPQFRASGDRAKIERLLGILSVIGLLGVGVYFASTDWGLAKLGLESAERETRENVTAVLDIAWVVLILVSTIPLCFAEAALYPMRNAVRLEARRVAAAAASGATLAFAAAYCALFVYAASESDVQVDYSYFKTSAPSEGTINMLKDLENPLKITAFFPEVSEVRKEVRTYFNQLQEKAGNVDFSMHDRYLEPALAEKLRVNAAGSVVLQQGEGRNVMTIGADMKTAQPILKKLDREFQERLTKLVRSRRTAYFTVGHGELNDERRGINRTKGRSATALKSLITEQNYLVRDLGLSQGLGKDVPKDASIVFILGPTEPFAPEELAALKRYADHGGKLFMALDIDSYDDSPVPSGMKAMTEPSKPTVKTISAKADKEEGESEDTEAATKEEKTDPLVESQEALAKIVHLKFEPTHLANQQNFIRRFNNPSDHALIYSNHYSSHASVTTLSRNSARAPTVFKGASSLDKEPNTKAKVDFTIRTTVGTFDDKNGNYVLDRPQEGPINHHLAAAVSLAVDDPAAKGDEAKGDDKKEAAEAKDDAKKGDEKKDDKDKKDKKDEKSEPNEMRAFVLADADAVSDLILMGGSRPNAFLAYDAIRWLAGEESWTGGANVEEDVRIEHSEQKDRAWFYATIFGVPLFVLLGGLFVSTRARRKGGKR